MKIRLTKKFVKNIMIWTRALRSGDFNQGVGTLENNGNFCCLGVGCKVFIKPKQLSFNNDGSLSGFVPEAQPFASEWLKEIDYDFYERTGTRLSCLNDGHSGFTTGLNFNEIADLLEAVYIHKVME